MGGYYRHTGNVKQHLGNATTSTTVLHYSMSDLWKNPRGTMLRIEALALVAITLSFFLATFGSCRRWSNRWIIQKGFLAAQVLSLSLGTYSIGLMQSSSVKSEMYPIWAVSLLTLFGCVDPISTYNGLDYMGPFSKMVYQLCLYCGYVLLMSISTISSVVCNLAIGMLSAITFIRGFHRSFALVLPTVMRDQLRRPVSPEPAAFACHGKELNVPPPDHHYVVSTITMDDIQSSMNHLGGNLGASLVISKDMTMIEDVCLGYSLSHMLKRRFLGLDTPREMEEKRERFDILVGNGAVIDYMRALKAIEIELSFLYEVFFTSNEFLHCYEEKSTNLWLFASFIGICFVGVATATTGTLSRSSRHHTTSAGIVVVVDTTTADLIITLVILASLALLQVVQLIHCWTSNWARVRFAYEYARNRSRVTNQRVGWWMRSKVFAVTRINWFDKYLWQDKIGQYSLVGGTSGSRWLPKLLLLLTCPCWLCFALCTCGRLPNDCQYEGLSRMLGMEYVGHLLGNLLGGYDTEPDVRLCEQDDVKARITEFLGQIKSRKIGVDWSSLFVENGLCLRDLPCYSSSHGATTPDAYAFTCRVIAWHIATLHCEQAEQQGSDSREKKNRYVATALSKYCAYLLVSTPELLPGPSVETKRAYECEYGRGVSILCMEEGQHRASERGKRWGERLLNEISDHWEVLALLWVQTLLYAAPYGDVQRHMQHLSQGGEFITHLWALLYHIGIDKWEREEAAGETGQGEMEDID